MNFSDFKKIRQRRPVRDEPRERRPTLTKQEQRFLYSLHLKTIENRTLMTTLKQWLSPSQLDEIIVDYALRLRKARKNFTENNIDKEMLLWEDAE
jgi:hypothetical protein